MSQINYRITLPAAAQMELSAGINKTLFPLLSQTVRAVAGQAAKDWKESVYRAKLWSGEKDAYANSITVRETGDFSAMVEADYKHAAEIETGRPARDLKKMLDTSEKVRRTEDGRRFLVIPLRHNTPGNGAHAKSMSDSVYGLAKAMTPSRVVSKGQRESGEVVKLSPKSGMSKGQPNANFLSSTQTKQAATVGKMNTAWGGRLTAQMLKSAGADKETVRRYSGMVKLDTSANGQKSSAYTTFRIMMEGSKGWVVPAQPGLYLARTVAQELEPKAIKAFELAIKKTMAGG